MSTSELHGAVPATRVHDRFQPARSPFSWLLQRECIRYLRIWQYSVLGQIVYPLMMLLVFGFALSHKVTVAGGIPYDSFMLPGLIAQTLMMVGYINGATSLFDARRDRYINDVLASPLRWWEINLACVLAAVIRSVITAGAVALAGGLIVHAQIADPLVLFLGAAGAMLFGAQFGVIIGVYVRTMDQNISVQVLAVQPLSLLGGTFYSVASLPSGWRALSHLNPIYYIVQVLRIGLVGRADCSATLALLVVWALALALTVWSLRVFYTGRRLRG
ncbi:MAG TPA: ABC transporter permease [Solirubrobacteraceae bacterium]|nr:ABC transporter permease [Solirubrobacteraceae bacterium]